MHTANTSVSSRFRFVGWRSPAYLLVYKEHRVVRSVISVLGVLFLSGVVGAQTQRGTIVGTITDPTGAVIPNVSVQVANDQTGAKFDSVGNSTGYYNIPYLPYGHYTLTANVTGFKTFTAQAVEVATATTTTLNITLEVGNAAEAVSVIAS